MCVYLTDIPMQNVGIYQAD